MHVVKEKKERANLHSEDVAELESVKVECMTNGLTCCTNKIYAQNIQFKAQFRKTRVTLHLWLYDLQSSTSTQGTNPTFVILLTRNSLFHLGTLESIWFEALQSS